MLRKRTLLGRCLLLGFDFLLVWHASTAYAVDQSSSASGHSWQKEVIATVGAVQGDTKVQRAGEAQFKKIAAKSPLYVMDFLSTGKNSKLWWQGAFNAFTPSDRWKPGPDVTHGSLGADSIFGFKQFERAGASYRFVGYVQKGTVRFIKTLPNTNPPSKFMIGAQTAWIEVLYSDRAADFIVESKNEALTTVTVLWGKVRVRNVSPEIKESRVLTSCQEVDVERDQEPSEIKWVSSDTMKELVKRTTIPRTLSEDVPSCERLKSELILDQTEVYLPPPGVALFPVVPVPVPVPPGKKECCPPGQMYDPRTGKCRCPCPEGELPPVTVLDNNGSAIDGLARPCGSCRRGATFNPETCACECPCPQGFLLPGQGCIAQCPEGFSVAYDSSNSPPYRCAYCVQHPPGTVVEPTPPPMRQCQDDTHCDSCEYCVDSACVPKICKEGFYLDRVRCECLPVKDGEPLACSENAPCPPCKLCVRGKCIPLIVSCPDQQRLNLETCKCEPLDGSIPRQPTPPTTGLPKPPGSGEGIGRVPVAPHPGRPETPETLQSVTPPLCQNDRDCPDGRVCRHGKCVGIPQVEKPECRRSLDCPIGQVCRKGKCVSEDEPSGPTGSEIPGSYTGPGRIGIGPQFGPGVGGIQPGSPGMQHQVVPRITPQMPIQRVPRSGRVN
jgi:Cys-rich repeat protein